MIDCEWFVCFYRVRNVFAVLAALISIQFQNLNLHQNSLEFVFILHLFSFLSILRLSYGRQGGKDPKSRSNISKFKAERSVAHDKVVFAFAMFPCTDQQMYLLWTSVSVYDYWPRRHFLFWRLSYQRNLEFFNMKFLSWYCPLVKRNRHT